MGEDEDIAFLEPDRSAAEQRPEHEPSRHDVVGDHVLGARKGDRGERGRVGHLDHPR